MCESTSSQPPLNRFRLLAQDMMEHSSAAAVTVDTEVITYFADCKTYWVTNANKYPLLATLAQYLLSAPASEAYVERVFSVCGELTAGKRIRVTKSLEKRIMLKMNLKYYAWFSMFLFSRLLVNISGSSAW